MKKFTLIILLFVSIISADTIHFINGDTLDNCKILSQNEAYQNETYVVVEYVYYSKVLSHSFILSSIENIEQSEYNPDKESVAKLSAQTLKNSFAPPNFKMVNSSPQFKINYKMLPLSVLSFVLGYDYADNAKDIKDLIDQYKEQHYDTKDLEKEKNKYMTKSIIFFGVGIINTIFSFEKVDVETDNNSLKVSYNF